MSASTLNFLDGVRRACTGGSETPLILLGNFEVEDEWARDEVGLPAVGSRASAAIVNRLDVFALLLAAKGDHVVLKSAPDPDFLAFLDGLGLDLPNLLLADEPDPARTVSADALCSPRLLAALRVLGVEGAQLLPHGMSALEEQLCQRTGVTAALPPARLVKAVNSKIYSRRVAAELGLAQAPGWECETVAEFAAAARQAAVTLRAGRRVGVKDAFGVSGKGIVVVDDEKRLDQLVRMVSRRAERSGDQRVALVVEEWVDKALDLNYHFTVGRDGSVRFDFVKEAFTAGGVHKGHRIPARIPPDHYAQIERTAAALGTRLVRDGFHGVAGVDAIVTRSGQLMPVLEINARNNMSTYQTSLQQRFMTDGTVALARQYDVSLTGPLSFARLRDHLGGLLFTPAAGTGLLVNNFATVNAAAAQQMPGRPYSGRLYGLLLAGGEHELTDLDAAVRARLSQLTGGGRGHE